MARHKELTSLADILRKVQEKNPQLGKRLVEAQAVSRWESAVGPQIAKHARAIKVQRGELWVEVDHPIWKTELHHRKQQILDRLNEGASPGEPAITDLFWMDTRSSR